MSSELLLPFLYQTRTIFRPLLRTSSRYASLSTSTVLSRKPCYAPHHNHKRLEIPDRDAQADISPGYNPNSTLTPLEDQAFRRIFEAAAKGLPPPSLQKKLSVEETEKYVLGESLDNFFRTIDNNDGLVLNTQASAQSGSNTTKVSTKELQRLPQRSRLEGFPDALRTALRDVQRHIGNELSRKRTVSERKATTEAVSRREDAAVEKEVKEFRMRLQNAKSDLEIWVLLDETVFSRVRQLIQMVNRQTADPQHEKASVSLNGEMNKSKIRKRKKTNTYPEGDPQAGPQKRELPLAVSTREEIESFDRIQHTYARHLHSALQSLRLKFPRSPVIRSISVTVKTLGPISTVLGFTTRTYNELLYLFWRNQYDIFECAQIVDDMYAQGISGDAYTSAVLIDAQNDMQTCLEGSKMTSETRQEWWKLDEIQKAMARWRKTMDLIDARTEEEMHEESQREQESWRYDEIKADSHDLYGDEIIAERADKLS